MELEPKDLEFLVDSVHLQQEEMLRLSVQMEALLAALEQSNDPAYTKYKTQVRSLEKGISKKPEFDRVKRLLDLAARVRGRE
jgi:hypothetical protein